MRSDDSDPIPGRPPWQGHPPEGFVPFPDEAVESSIGARLEAVAAEHGDREALRGPGGVRTHAELWSIVASRALALRERLGQPAETQVVALVLSHDVAQVETLLAVLAAGQTALVIDPTAPEAMSASLVADADARLVVVDDAHHGSATEWVPAGHPLVLVDELTGAEGTLPPVAPGTAALLAYTSGSSGDAKAAVVPHRQLLHLMRGATAALAITAEDRLPMMFPISLAVAAYPAFLPLLNGGSLTTFDVRGEGLADLPAWIAREHVTVAYLAPTVLRFLEGSVGDTTFPDLRLVVLGGERVDRGAVDLVRELFGDHVLVANGYGTTETGVLSFWFDTGDGGEVPAGFPIDGMDLLILGDGGQPVSSTRSGELAVRSPYLFSGYRGRADLDAQVLTEDAESGLPVYRTGDLARLRPDGALELVGRVDTQVKIRGRRVVLGEVEDALLALDEVRDAVVVSDLDPRGHAGLVAHVVPEDPELTADALRAALAAAVPDHMVPGRFVLQAELPQLPNGKLDRQALAGAGGDRPALTTPYADPATDLEEAIVEIWQELLAVAPVGVDDDFFDLGGDSLLAARMLVELEARLGHRVPMVALIDGASVRSLALAVAEVEAGERPGSGLVVIQEGRPGRPTLYVPHDLHGSAFRFRHLAAALGPDQRVVGFESPALTGERFPFTRIETLALRYVTEMQRDQPEGPYHLCGYSFGGILAFEMARHLRRAGEEVGLLAIVDIGPGYRGIDFSRTRPPDGPWLDLPERPPAGTPRRSRVAHVARMAADSPRQAVEYTAFHSRARRRFFGAAWGLELRRRGQIEPRHRLWYAYQTHWDLVGPSWEGAPYDGPITLFWASDTGSTDATMGWGALASAVDIRRVSVPHERMMDEDVVDEVAGALRARLEPVITDR